ncbi:arylsulfotransferase family protein [Amylibacter sp.]|nr:arylsulfotransferase family protein [Amylibacter sp.]
MFKKIEAWVFYLVILFCITFTILFGFLVRQELVSSKKLGWVSKSALMIAELPVRLRQALGDDLVLPDRFPQLAGFSGSPLAMQNYFLLSRYDGDMGEGVVELIDLSNFKVVHVWNPNMDEINEKLLDIPEFAFANRDHNDSRARLHHPQITSNGEIIFISATLHKIDACSKHIFSLNETTAHHSIELDGENNIWVPTTRYNSNLPLKLIGPEPGKYSDHAITKIDQDGNILYSKSIAEIFLEHNMDYLLFSTGNRRFKTNPIHLNDIQPVLYDSPYFKKGDVFLSLRHQSMLMLYRPKTNEVIWTGTGKFYHQHDVDILDEQRISFFNNNSKDAFNGDIVDGFNEIVMYDFESNNYSYYLHDSMNELNMITLTEGTHEIMNNSDLVVEETNYGRISYLNSNGAVKWQYLNRATDGKVYPVSWSRLLYKEKDVAEINNFLLSKGACYD